MFRVPSIPSHILVGPMAEIRTHAHTRTTRWSIIRCCHKGKSLKRGYCCNVAGCPWNVRPVNAQQSMRKPAGHFFLCGFPWSCLALARRKVTPRKESAPATSNAKKARATEPSRGPNMRCGVVHVGPCACPAAESSRTDRLLEEKKVAHLKQIRSRSR